MNSLKKLLLVSASCAVLPICGHSQSNETEPTEESETRVFETVTVTARFREEGVQSIGASVGALGGDELTRDGIEDFDDISRRIVGIGLVDRGPNQNDVTIRGAASSVPATLVDTLPGSSPVVSQFFNDIPIGSPDGSQRDFNLYDLNRVEVLRGPQPTLFGEGSVGGTIRYISNEPSLNGDKPISVKTNADLSFTESGGVNHTIQGAVDYTLVPDALGVRVTGFYKDLSGFVDNPTTGFEDANDINSFGGSLTLLAEPTERIRLKLFAKVEEDDHGEGWLIDVGSDPSELTYSRPIAGQNKDDALLLGGTVTFEGDNYTLDWISGYYERDRNFSSWNPTINFIAGFASLPVLVAPIADTTTNTFRIASEEQVSQEVRFVSEFEGPLNFTAGLFYKDSKYDVVGETTELPGLEAITFPQTSVPLESETKRETEQYSGFAELTFDVSDKLSVIGGARYVHEDVVGEVAVNKAVFPFPPLINVGLLTYLSTPDLFAGVFDTEQTFELRKWLPKASLEYSIDDDKLIYASWSKGIRNGGVNSTGAVGFNTVVLGALPNDPAVTLPLLTYGEDETEALEIGAKTVWLGGDLTLNAALFQMDFNDVQTAFAPTGGFNMIVNASDQRVQGLELEGRWRVADWASTFFGVTLNDAEFRDDVDINFDNLITPGVDISAGNSPIGVADVQALFGLDFYHDIGSNGLELTGGLNATYLGERFTDAPNTAISKVPALSLVNARIGFQKDNWAISAYVNNLTNEIELVNSNPVQQYVNQPRVIGVSLSAEF